MVRNKTGIFPLVDDNDDKDKWVDQHFTYTISGSNRVRWEDHDGVFPGLDEDNDGLPDTNKNGNSLPDYEEPFLRFYVDAPEYIYGDDFNNNGTADYIEDDLEPDTPYDKGQEGAHFFIKLKPFESLNLIYGRHDGKLTTGGGRNRDHYFEINFRYSDRLFGNFYAEAKTEKIQDNIPDYIYTFSPTKPEEGRYSGGAGESPTLRQFTLSEWIDDEMMYRDSDVTRLYIQTQSSRFLGLSFINQIRFERNKQNGGYLYDGTFQYEDRVDYYTMITRVDGEYNIGNWSILPGIKFLMLKRQRDSIDIPISHQRTIIPRFIVQYNISDRTRFRLGGEVLPWLRFSYRDLAVPNNDRNETNYVFEVSNRSDYFGYIVYAFVGFQISKVDYRSELRKFESRATSTAYLRVILGY